MLGVGAYVAGCAALKYILHAANTGRPSCAQRVGTVSRLLLYPIKSARWTDLQSVTCDFGGFLNDRRFVLITAAGTMITARMQPKLTLVIVSLTGQQVELRAPDMDDLSFMCPTPEGDTVTVEVYGDKVTGVDCGAGVSAWWSRYLGKEGVRLLYMTDSTPPRILQDGRTCYHKQIQRRENKVAYHDFCSMMLITDKSLDDLNSRLPQPVTMETFRPNIVVRSDKRAYEEDHWKEVYIGDTKFSQICYCTRCKFTTVDPDIGKIRESGEPLKTLKTYRPRLELTGDAPAFGDYYITDWCGTINVGDPVYVIRG